MKPIWTGTYDRNNTPINVGDIVRDYREPNEIGFIVDNIENFTMLRELYQEESGVPIEAVLVIVGMED